MKLVFLKIIAFIAVNIYFSVDALTYQNEGNEDSFHSYDLFQLVMKFAEKIKTAQSLKLLSEDDMDFVIEFEKFLSLSINSTLLDMLSKASSNKCVKDFKYVFESLVFPGGWAMKMLDSYGKPESGILDGNINWLGKYDECVDIQAPSKDNTGVGDFRGKYCTLQVDLKLGPMALPISTAVCLPDSCSPNKTNFHILEEYNLNGSFAVVRERLKSVFSDVTLTCKNTSRNLTTGAIVIICLLSVFVLLAVIGSSLTAFENYEKGKFSKNHTRNGSKDGKPVNSAELKNGSQGETVDFLLPACLRNCKQFFNLFCIFTNGEKILNTSTSEEQLPFLHGIRFLSMTWVILGHTYQYMAFYLNNTAEAIDYIDRWPVQIIANAFFSVDSFFILSGFLVGYIFFQQAQKTDGKFPWLYFYTHRYIRLVPVYLIVGAFYSTVSPFLGSGPLWPDYEVVPACKENWWWNMLFINNFLPTASTQCMDWSWYLANDMQFYVISPLFLITLWRWPKVGYSLLGLFFCITFACNFVLTYEYDLIAGVGNLIASPNDILKFMPRMTDFFHILYNKPYARMGPYLVGLALAYYVHRRKRSGAKSLNWVTLSVGWIVASGITLTCQFGLYHQVLTTLEASFYNALSRVGFALGLGWVIFVCVIGQGGFVNSILSWKAMIPFSRLSYCVYLVHPIVLNTYFFSMRTLIYFNHMNVIMLYFGFLVISYAIALVTSLVFESPVIRLDKLIRNKFES